MTDRLELYIVRHGNPKKTDADGVPYKDEERPLSPQGLEEVTQLAQHLLELNVTPDVIMSSIFVRAQETANIIAAHLGNPPVVISELLIESDLGTTSHTKEGLRDVQYGYDTAKILEAGGEPVEQIEERISRLLELIQAEGYSTIVVVSHGLPMSILAQLVQDLERRFATIQPLQTGDYSYFLLEPKNSVPAKVAKTSVLRGPLPL